MVDVLNNDFIPVDEMDQFLESVVQMVSVPVSQSHRESANNLPTSNAGMTAMRPTNLSVDAAFPSSVEEDPLNRRVALRSRRTPGTPIYSARSFYGDAALEDSHSPENGRALRSSSRERGNVRSSSRSPTRSDTWRSSTRTRATEVALTPDTASRGDNGNDWRSSQWSSNRAASRSSPSAAIGAASTGSNFLDEFVGNAVPTATDRRAQTAASIGNNLSRISSRDSLSSLASPTQQNR